MNSAISRREFVRGIGAGATLACAGWPSLLEAALRGEKADLALLGGRILTVDPKDSVARAVAIKGNRILAVGKRDSDVKPFIGPRTKTIELKGRTVTPGLIDVHNHIVAQAYAKPAGVDLMRCPSCKAVRETLANYILERGIRPGEWVMGLCYAFLWDKIAARKKDPAAGPPIMTRMDIDQSVTVKGKTVDLRRYPVYLIQLSGHYASANALALIKAKIMDRSGGFYTGPDARCVTYPRLTVGQAFAPQKRVSGSYFSTRGGKLDGAVYHHYAMEELIARANRYGGLKKVSDGEKFEALKEISGEFLRMGVTSIQDNNLRWASYNLEDLRRFGRSCETGDLVRLTFYPYICDLKKGAFPAYDTPKKKGVFSCGPRFEDPWMRLAGYKLQLDAAAMTGMTYGPNRGPGIRDKGRLHLWDPESYREIVREIQKRGMQASIHVVGDKSLDWTLDAYAAAGAGKDDRHRIEHLVCVPPTSRDGAKGGTKDTFDRFRDMGIVMCPQPGFILYYGMFFENIFGPKIPELRENRIYPRMAHSVPFASALENGVRVALSSDYPCVPNANPLIALWSSCHRRTRRMGKGGKVFVESFVYNHPTSGGTTVDERVSFAQAVRGHTADAAYAGRDEKRVGSIEEGKLADLVVWNRDVSRIGDRIPVMALKDYKPDLTLLGGRIVHRAT